MLRRPNFFPINVFKCQNDHKNKLYFIKWQVNDSVFTFLERLFVKADEGLQQSAFSVSFHTLKKRKREKAWLKH